MRRPLQRIGGDDRAPGLVGEQVDGVRGVVPEQVVGPDARLAERVDVGAAEEVRLHVHLLDRELAGLDPLVHPLVARVEAARVADHADEAGLLLRPRATASASAQLSASGISTCTCLPARMHSDGLLGVQRRRRGTGSTASTSPSARAPRPGRSVADGDAVFVGDRPRPARAFAPTIGDDLDTVDVAQRVEVLAAERAGAGEGDAQLAVAGLSSPAGSRIDVADRRVRRRHVVEAVATPPPRHLDSAPRMISHMTISMPSEPASRRYSRCGILRSSLGVGDQLVEERLVELRLMRPARGALQLVAHPAGAPDLHVEVLVVARPHAGSPRRAGSSGCPTAIGYWTTLTGERDHPHGHASGCRTSATAARSARGRRPSG